MHGENSKLILERSLTTMNLIDCWLALIAMPFHQQQCVTALPKLACSLSIGMLLHVKRLLRLFCVNNSKDANDSVAGTTSGDNKHKSKDVIEDTLQLSVSKTLCKMTRKYPAQV